MMAPMRVLIVADDPLVRAALARMLEDEPECSLVGQIPSETDMDASLEVYQPDILLWDLGWEAERNFEQIAELDNDTVPIVCLVPDDSFTEDALTAGVRGLLSREVESAVLVSALRAVHQGLATLDPALAMDIFSSEQAPPSYSIDALTSRELDVLNLLAEGLTNKAIALQLGISEFTVKFYVNAILRKLGAQSRTDAVIRAARMGLISL